jgi:hypothetical protein
MADDLDTKDEIAEATEDLRDALHKVNGRVEETVAKLRPGVGIRKHPLTTAWVAGALGFALGAESAEVGLIGLVLLGGAIVLSHGRKHEPKIDDSDEIKRV